MSRRTALSAASLAVAGLAGCSAARDAPSTAAPPDPVESPWPTAGATPARTGRAPDARLPPEAADFAPLVESDDPAHGGIRGPPVAGAGTAYATAATGHVVARGTHEWTVELDVGARLPPTLAGGTVFAQTGAGVLALDARTGTERWRVESAAASPDLGDAAPTAVGDHLLVGTEVVAALTVESGEQAWLGRVPGETATWGVAATDERTVAVATGVNGDGGFLASFDGQGVRGWTVRPAVDHGPARPALADGRVYLASDAGTVSAFDAESGLLRWQRPVDADVETGVALADGAVVVPGAAGGTLRAFEADDGTPRWTVTTGYTTAPAVVEGQVLVGVETVPGTDGTTGFVALDPATGEVTRRYPTGVAGPFAVGDGTVYVRRGTDSSLWRLG